MRIYDIFGASQVHVSDIENPEDASFFESYEAAHSLHDLSSSIAKVLLCVCLSLHLSDLSCYF